MLSPSLTFHETILFTFLMSISSIRVFHDWTTFCIIYSFLKQITSTSIQKNVESVFNTPSRLCSKVPNTTCYSWFSQYDHVPYCFLCQLSSFAPSNPPPLPFPPCFLLWKADLCGPHTLDPLLSGFLLGTANGRLGRRWEAGRRVRLGHLLLWLPLLEVASVWLHHWTESHCSSQGTLLLMTLSFHIQRPLLRFTLADLGVFIVLSLLALGSCVIPCTFLTPLHTFIISVLINKHFLNCPNLNVPSISLWETDWS